MAPPKRPALSGLIERKSPPVVAPVADTGDAGDAAEEFAGQPRAPSPSDLKTMQVRVNRAGWVEMSRLAQDLDIPLETLMVEAYNDVLVKHGKPPVVERRQPVKKA